VFSKIKTVYSVYNNGFRKPLKSSLATKLAADGIDGSALMTIKDGVDFNNLTKLAAENSDGIIFATEKIDEQIRTHIAGMGKPLLECQGEENYIDVYNDFYDKLLLESKK
jgi:starch synthase